MPEPLTEDISSLDELRREIDATDAELHRLLIHRGMVIERLIAAKRLGDSGAAFRPDREAEMMRRLAARHRGRLPLSTVEHIWREIIGTFTQLQAPFGVHAAGAGEPGMRDLLRYHFGFATPILAAGSDRAAIDAVAASGSDLAVVAYEKPLGERWWDGLSTAPGGAKVIAALPFLPADPRLALPRALVIGPADIDAPEDVFVYAVAALDGPPAAAVEVLARAGETALVAAPVAPDGFHGAGAVPLGSFAAPLISTDGRRP